MKDIDFDELDRAVSSVLGQKTPADQATQDTAVAVSAREESATLDTTAAQPIASSPTDSPSSDVQQNTPLVEDVAPIAPVESPIPEPVAAPGPQVPLAVKRRGKFMDMVHPSAAMTTTNKSVSTRPLGTHEGFEVKPQPQTSETEEKTEEKPLATTPAVESTVEHKSEPIAAVDESQAPIGAEPVAVDNGSHTLPAETADEPNLDPLANFKEEDTQVDGVAEGASAGDAESTAASTSALASTVPPVTPFLSDTKVEKRPLGGFSDSTSDTAVSTEAPATDDTQSAPAVPLPRELQSDVMKVESSTEVMSEASGPGAAPFATNVEAAPEPTDDDRVEGHPLFDTSTYHEPIAAVPHSKMPTWLKWLLGLLVCLVLGAGVGYFLFTAGL